MTADTPAAAIAPPLDGEAQRRAWKQTLLLTAAVFVIRVVFLVFINPLELVGDEAHYWEWSRRPDISYYSKGPGVAWTILASTKIFGDSEGAIRFPAALMSAVAMLALARFARDCYGDARIGFYAAAAFAIAPVFQGFSLFMTIDAPYVTFWILSAWAAWKVLSNLEAGRSGIVHWLLLAAALGIGFLFKFTILLLAPGILIALLLRRKNIRWTGGAWLGLIAGLALFAAICSPVILWNMREGWPTFRHLIGAVGMKGGDMPVSKEPWHYTPRWMLELIGAQIVLIGPLMALIVIGVIRTLRKSAKPQAADALLFWSAVPIFVFYLGVTVLHKAQANWPIAGWATLLILAARVAAIEMEIHTARIRQWRSRGATASESSSRPCSSPMDTRHTADSAEPALAVAPRKPTSLPQVAWHWSVGVGVVMAAVVLLIGPLDRLHLIPKFIPMHRLSGQRDAAAVVSSYIEMQTQDNGKPPLIFVLSYQRASLLAYYLPGHPRVYCAGRYLGTRASQYDYFTDTNLGAPAIRGRNALLIGAKVGDWAGTFDFDLIQRLDAKASEGGKDAASVVCLGTNYQGPLKGAGAPTREQLDEE